jgi:uncharacterized membrane protein
MTKNLILIILLIALKFYPQYLPLITVISTSYILFIINNTLDIKNTNESIIILLCLIICVLTILCAYYIYIDNILILGIVIGYLIYKTQETYN